jgi:hypothetical protein
MTAQARPDAKLIGASTVWDRWTLLGAEDVCPISIFGGGGEPCSI